MRSGLRLLSSACTVKEMSRLKSKAMCSAFLKYNFAKDVMRGRGFQLGWIHVVVYEDNC